MALNRPSLAAARRRRWLTPIVVLLVAGGVAWWASARETARMAEVQHNVRRLCVAIARGRDVTGMVNPASPSGERQVIRAIQAALPPSDAMEVLDIIVTPGETDATASSIGAKATHTVMLQIDDVELLRLRVQHRDREPRLVVVGYQKPQPVN